MSTTSTIPTALERIKAIKAAQELHLEKLDAERRALVGDAVRGNKTIAEIDQALATDYAAAIAKLDGQMQATRLEIVNLKYILEAPEFARPAPAPEPHPRIETLRPVKPAD